MKKIFELPLTPRGTFLAAPRLQLLSRFIQRCESHTQTPPTADPIEMELSVNSNGTIVSFNVSGPGPTINGVGVRFARKEVEVSNHVGRLCSFSYPSTGEVEERAEHLLKTVLDYFNPPSTRRESKTDLIPLVIAAVFEELKRWAEPPVLEITTSYHSAVTAQVKLLCTTGPREGAWSLLERDAQSRVYMRTGLGRASEAYSNLPINVDQSSDAIVADIAAALLVPFLPIPPQKVP